MSASNHKDNFDFIRLVAATTVLVNHQYALTGAEVPSLLPGFTWGNVSVMVFFVISGYFVTQSWLYDPQVLRFVARRLLRLLPALALVACLTVLVLGPLVTELGPAQYFSSGDTWRYLNVVRLAIVYELPGVFLHNPYPKVVNGSLWTLQLEGRWYLMVVLFGLLGALRFPFLMLLAWVGGAIWLGLSVSPDGKDLPDVFWLFGVFFLAGIYFATTRNDLRRFGSLTILLTVLGAVAFLLGQRFTTLVLLLPLPVLWFGSRSYPVIRAAGRFGDLSYGVYAFAFPVQQTLILLLGKSTPFVLLLTCSLAITYALALMSWRLVESPALELKRYFRKRTSAGLIQGQGGETIPINRHGPL